VNLDKTSRAENRVHPEFLTGPQLCKKLQIPHQTLLKWRKDGIIPFMKVRSVIRYDLHKVLESIEFGTPHKILWDRDSFLAEYVNDMIEELKTSSMTIPFGLKLYADYFDRDTIIIKFSQGMNSTLIIMPEDSFYNDDHWQPILAKLFGRGISDGW